MGFVTATVRLWVLGAHRVKKARLISLNRRVNNHAMNYDRVRVLLPTSLHAFGIINEAQKFRQLLAAIRRASSRVSSYPVRSNRGRVRR